LHVGLYHSDVDFDGLREDALENLSRSNAAMFF
jgi:hypothetical protein